MQLLHTQKIKEPVKSKTFLPTYLCDSIYCSDSSDRSDSSE